MRAALTILAIAALLLLGAGASIWWMVQSDWYDKGMMDD